MKRLFLLALTLNAFHFSFSQRNLISSRFSFDTTYQIIGLCHFADKNITYHDLTFIISDIDSLQKVKQEIMYGNKVAWGRNNPPLQPKQPDGLPLNINIVKNKKIVDVLSFYPEQSSITFVNRIDSIAGTFEFDIQKIIALSSETSINYTTSKKTFTSKKELDDYININKNKKKFLCYDIITSSYEGLFQLSIQGTNTFTTQEGFNLINQEFGRNSISKSEYQLGYRPNFKNLSHFIYEIQTTKANYDKFHLSAFSKGKWVPTTIELLTYWLK